MEEGENFRSTSADSNMDAENRTTNVEQSQELIPESASSSSSSLSDADSESTLHNGSIASTPPNERATPAQEVNSDFGTEPTERSDSGGSRSAGQLSPSGPLSGDENGGTFVVGTIVNAIPIRRAYFAKELEYIGTAARSYSVGSHSSGGLSPSENSDAEGSAPSTRHPNRRIYIVGAVGSRKSKRRGAVSDSDTDFDETLENAEFEGTIRAPRLARNVEGATIEADMDVMTPDEEYATTIVNALRTKDAVLSLVCCGAHPTELHTDAEVDEGKIGRGLVRSYLTTAYNAAAEVHGDKLKALEHCMMRTVGPGLVQDYTGRVWSSDTAGVYVCFYVSSEQRNEILDTTNRILAETESPSAAMKAFLDLLLLPLAHDWDGDDLTIEVMVYVRYVSSTFALQVSSAERVTIRDALSKVNGFDTQYGCCLLGLLSVEFGLEIPACVPDDSFTRQYLEVLSGPDWTECEDERRLRVLKFRIENIGEGESSALWASMYLDLHLERDSWPDDLNRFANRLERADWIESIDVYRIRHRHVTGIKVLGVRSVTKSVKIKGGYIDPADHGEITVEQLSGRCVGYVDGNRRVVVYFDDNNDVVVGFKDARNYFLNVLHFIRPKTVVETNSREEVIDRNKLIGLPALHLLMRGALNAKLARFVVACLTYGAIKLKEKRGSLASNLFGCSDGSYEYDAVVSSSILSAMPVLIARDGDRTIRTYLYNNCKTYRLRLHGASWVTYREEPKGALKRFGKLSTPYPLARKRGSKT